jgi:hypothetical protein
MSLACVAPPFRMPSRPLCSPPVELLMSRVNIPASDLCRITLTSNRCYVVGCFQLCERRRPTNDFVDARFHNDIDAVRRSSYYVGYRQRDRRSSHYLGQRHMSQVRRKLGHVQRHCSHGITNDARGDLRFGREMPLLTKQHRQQHRPRLYWRWQPYRYRRSTGWDCWRRCCLRTVVKLATFLSSIASVSGIDTCSIFALGEVNDLSLI